MSDRHHYMPDGGARYTSAWLEISTRIASRQTVHTVHVTVVVLAIGFIAQSGLASRDDAWRFATLLLPVVTLSVALWSRHNDATLGLLSAYCRALEESADRDNSRGIPSWHSAGQGWMSAALVYRRFSDFAFILVAIVAAVPSVHLLVQGACLARCLSGLSLLAVLGSIVMIWRNAGLRREFLMKYQFVPIGEEWKFVKVP